MNMRLLADITTILSDISKLNLEIYRSANDKKAVQNLSKGIANSLETITDLIRKEVMHN